MAQSGNIPNRALKIDYIFKILFVYLYWIINQSKIKAMAKFKENQIEAIKNGIVYLKQGVRKGLKRNTEPLGPIVSVKYEEPKKEIARFQKYPNLTW